MDWMHRCEVCEKEFMVSEMYQKMIKNSPDVKDYILEASCPDFIKHETIKRRKIINEITSAVKHDVIRLLFSGHKVTEVAILMNISEQKVYAVMQNYVDVKKRIKN